MRRKLGAGVVGPIVCTACIVFGLLGASSPLAASRDLGIQGHYPDRSPHWSPDGHRLAFTRGEFDIDHSWLSLISRDGSGLRSTPRRYLPLWSPDGGRMALMDGRTVWLANGDGTRPMRIGDGWTADWSPDGKLLALNLGGRLWVVNRDGTGLRRLPIDVPTCRNCKSDEASPSWSPNGRTLVFEHGEAEPGSWGSASVWAADVDGQNLRLLAAPGESPQWSPDGTKIAFLSFSSHYDEVPSVHAINADGSHDRSFGLGESLSWSPRGGRLAYESAGPRKRVYLVRPGHGIVYLRAAASPSWAPDGKRIAFERRGSIYVADANGKRQRRVASGSQPSWSPDGRLIAYTGASCGPDQGIHLVSPSGRPRRRLTDFCFIVGTAGHDRIHGTAGTDRVLAGPGNDLIFVRDHRRDIVSCGPGIDRAIADRLDVLTGCERTRR